MRTFLVTMLAVTSLVSLLAASFIRGYTLEARAVTKTPAEAEVTCEVWAEVAPFKIARCEDEWTGEVCFHSTSGMMQCRLD